MSEHCSASEFLNVWIDARHRSAGCPSLGDQFSTRVALCTTDTADWISLPDNPAILLSRGHTAVPRVPFIFFVFSSISVRNSRIFVLSNSHQTDSEFPFSLDNASYRVATALLNVHLTINFITERKECMTNKLV